LQAIIFEYKIKSVPAGWVKTRLIELMIFLSGIQIFYCIIKYY